jgi:hypothetical protein
VLWCYSNAYRLAQQGLWNVCVDEIPNYVSVMSFSPH